MFTSSPLLPHFSTQGTIRIEVSTRAGRCLANTIFDLFCFSTEPRKTATHWAAENAQHLACCLCSNEGFTSLGFTTRQHKTKRSASFMLSDQNQGGNRASRTRLLPKHRPIKTPLLEDKTPYGPTNGKAIAGHAPPPRVSPRSTLQNLVNVH